MQLCNIPAGETGAMSVLGKIKRTISKYSMVERGDRIVIGVSGGPDSVMLCHALHELKDSHELNLTVAHLNHGARGAEAARDAQFVVNLARSLSLPCVVKTCDVPSYQRQSARSFQDAAREVRYRFLEEVREECQGGKIALGHNADDQAETVMLWLLRGTGPRGLGGMPPVRDGVIIRPLLETTREEIESYLGERGISFIVDSSNEKDVYLRNRLRREIFPRLKQHFNPQLVKHLVATASIIRSENEYLDECAHNALEDMLVSRDATSAVLSLPHFVSLDPVIRLRCLRLALERVKGDLRRIGTAHLNGLMGIARSTEPYKILALPEGVRAEKSYHTLTLSREQADRASFCYQFSELPERVVIREIGMEMTFSTASECGGAVLGRDSSTACLDADKAAMPLTIRSIMPGDRFQPLGMEGRKKVKDLFIDEKVPRAERTRVPLVLFQGEIAWVGGMRIDHRMRVTEKTGRMLRITLEPSRTLR